MKSEVRAKFIFEMLGKPPEYLKESLETHIKGLESENIKIISQKIHEPKLLEKEKAEGGDLYTSFAEVEVEVKNLSLIFYIVIKMLPSHIEILSPTDLSIKNFELGEVLTELAVKLHKYDEVAKVLMMERDDLARQLNILRGHVLKNTKVQEINKEKDKVDKKD